MFWWHWFGYLGVVAAIFARARALYPGRAVRLLVVIEDPGNPLSVEAAQLKLADTGATVIPGFSVTP